MSSEDEPAKVWPKVWSDEDHAYAVVTAQDGTREPWRSGLSHAAAMRLAEAVRREGGTAIVLHVVGEKSYEVDRYPVR